MKSLSGQFADWVRAKPADEEYDYFGHCAPCAMHQLLSAAGYPVRGVGGTFWTDADGNWHELPGCGDTKIGAFSLALAARPNTFGALAVRLANLGQSV